MPCAHFGVKAWRKYDRSVFNKCRGAGMWAKMVPWKLRMGNLLISNQTCRCRVLNPCTGKEKETLRWKRTGRWRKPGWRSEGRGRKSILRQEKYIPLKRPGWILLLNKYPTPKLLIIWKRKNMFDSLINSLLHLYENLPLVIPIGNDTYAKCYLNKMWPRKNVI